MDDKALQKLLSLAPGEFRRMHSGYFQGLPGAEIAFLPSIFRLHWHSKQPRVVGSKEISRILRAELVEVLALVIVSVISMHLFFIDILNFYLLLFDNSIFISVVAHATTLIIFVIVALLLNNVPFAWIRGRIVAKSPIAEGALTRDLLRDWRLERRLWRFSLTSDERAAQLRKWGIVFYVILFCISMPIFSFIIVFIIKNEKLTADNIYLIFLFICYGSLSIWAFVESITVLRRRIKESQERIQLQKRVEELEQAEEGSDPDSPHFTSPREEIS